MFPDIVEEQAGRTFSVEGCSHWDEVCAFTKAVNNHHCRVVAVHERQLDYEVNMSQSVTYLSHHVIQSLAPPTHAYTPISCHSSPLYFPMSLPTIHRHSPLFTSPSIPQHYLCDTSLIATPKRLPGIHVTSPVYHRLCTRTSLAPILPFMCLHHSIPSYLSFPFHIVSLISLFIHMGLPLHACPYFAAFPYMSLPVM
jgi:hypothetical protein